VLKDTTPTVDPKSTVLGKQKRNEKAMGVEENVNPMGATLLERPWGSPQHQPHACEKECMWEFTWDPHE